MRSTELIEWLKLVAADAAVGAVTGASGDLFFVIDATDGNLRMVDFDDLDVAAQSHIVDADGTLADATTKINAILVALETYGILDTS